MNEEERKTFDALRLPKPKCMNCKNQNKSILYSRCEIFDSRDVARNECVYEDYKFWEWKDE